MWIRSQNKEVLLPINKIAILENYNEIIEVDGYYLTCSNVKIGNYKTKER